MAAYRLSVNLMLSHAGGDLLLLRRDSGQTHFAGCWEWPGGKIEPGESFADAEAGSGPR